MLTSLSITLKHLLLASDRPETQNVTFQLDFRQNVTELTAQEPVQHLKVFLQQEIYHLLRNGQTVIGIIPESFVLYGEYSSHVLQHHVTKAGTSNFYFVRGEERADCTVEVSREI